MFYILQDADGGELSHLFARNRKGRAPCLSEEEWGDPFTQLFVGSRTLLSTA